MRFANFKDAFWRAKSLSGNAPDSPFGINSFSDWYEYELPRKGLKSDIPFQMDMLGSQEMGTNASHASDTAVLKPQPAAINWRLTRAVSPVKNQGSCGACWAFVTAEEVESMYTLWQGGGGGGYSEIFSVQQMISCSVEADGCGGGNPVNGYNYVMKSQVGLVQEAFWPYEGGYLPEERCDYKYCTKPCHKNLTDAATYQHIIGPIGRVRGALWATPLCDPGSNCDNQNLESLRRTLVQLGPVAVAVNSKNWFHYAGGVLSYDACGGSTWNDLDHAAQLTGYNTTGEKPHWIVRNQWSTTWGENGYIHLEFGRNTCGIANMATVPLVDGMPDLKDMQTVQMLQTSQAAEAAEATSRSAPFFQLYRQAVGEAPSL
ncbi:unnamed protein product [Durusdinium trenchii]